MKFNNLPAALTQGNISKLGLGLLGFLVPLAWQQAPTMAASLSVPLTPLTGATGGTPAGTQVFRANLSNLGFNLGSITIQDTSGGVGGSPGRFSGFDLDAIKLSRTFTSNASDVNSLTSATGLTGPNTFNFTPAGTLFARGTQRSPVNPKLFGTDATGNAVDNNVATLGSFDGNSTTNLTPPVRQPTGLSASAMGVP